MQNGEKSPRGTCSRSNLKKRRTLAFALGTVQNFVVVQNFVLCKTLQLQNGGKIGEIRGALPPREVQPLPAKIQLCALSTLIYNLHLSCTLHCALSTLLNTVQLFNCSILFNFTGFHWTQLRAGFSVLAPAFSEQNAPAGQFKCTVQQSLPLHLSQCNAFFFWLEPWLPLIMQKKTMHAL